MQETKEGEFEESLGEFPKKRQTPISFLIIFIFLHQSKNVKIKMK